MAKIYFCFITLSSCLALAWAGPFYECRPGSELKYQVNLCVDRCPTVGSQDGCSDNRTCCLVGCARICFNERRSTPVPVKVKTKKWLTTLKDSTSPPALTAAVAHIRRHSDISALLAASGDREEILVDENELKESGEGNDTYDRMAEEDVKGKPTLPTTVITSEATSKMSSSSSSTPSTSESSTSTTSTTTTTTTTTMATTTQPTIHAKVKNEINPRTPVLGKLRFSATSDKSKSVSSKELTGGRHLNVKSFQQWNVVNDNFNNALDDAQQAANLVKGSDSSLMWQIFEFLRIIQTKIDSIGNNNGVGKWARFVGGEPLRSKPALSPNDPNILIRKSLSDFSKSVNKIHSEVKALTVGQQQILRILERVFVNQLRLANGAAAVATMAARREQRWQKAPQARQPLNQLTPLAEAIMLENASFMSPISGNRPNSDCYRLNGCSFDACRTTPCPKFPQATCKINSCRRCQVEFFIGNNKVEC